MLTMEQYLGKSLCAFLRKGDYAHAGETEAIDKVMAPFPKNNSHLILDVGCGLGGTANYIQENKWGQVVGVDIESDSINYAKARYPEVNFCVADVANIYKVIKDVRFDIFCFFNVFFTLSNQQQALSTLYKIAQPKASLAIFDYSDICESGEINPLLNLDAAKNIIFIPIKLHDIADMLSKSGWQLTKLVNISYDYQKWYKKLLEGLKHQRQEITRSYGKEYFATAISIYTKIYQSLIDKKSGGVIVYAEKS